MPLFKISEDLLKLSKEVLRIQITVLGDCPQCGGSQYISGVCEDCGYISPEVLEAIKDWQQSQGNDVVQQTRIQQQAQQEAQSRNPMPQLVAASSTFDESFPQLVFAKHDQKKKTNECPRCGRNKFDLQCEGCGYEEPPADLNFRSPEYTGISPELLKNKRRNFLPSTDALERIKDQKRKLHKKKKTHKKSSVVFSKGTDSLKNPDLDNVTTIEYDATNRIKSLVGDLATVDFENGLAQKPEEQE